MKYLIAGMMMMPTVVFALSLRQPVPDPVVIIYPDGSTYELQQGEYAYVSSDKVFQMIEKEVEDKINIILQEMPPNEYRDYDDHWEFVPVPNDPCPHVPNTSDACGGWFIDDEVESIGE